ncbi:MAG: TniB family NTP-binding protein [Nostoc sp.]|uniref:TniB family NTP-binding protein n=1 Tax=Nostoc sp. TaxID=1180 RepID=UPI002FF65016
MEHLKYQVTKGTVTEIRDRTLRVLKGCAVEMLIIDEADRFKPKTFAEVRDIFDRLGIAVILAGTDRLHAAIKRDEQVYNRFRSCQLFIQYLYTTRQEIIPIKLSEMLELP